MSLCESLLDVCPESCALRDALAELHIRKGEGDRAVSMWLHALAECPDNAEVFYHCCKFLMAQVSSAQHDQLHLLLLCYCAKCCSLILCLTGEVERHCSSVQRIHPEPV